MPRDTQEHYHPTDDEISLLDLLEILWKKKRLILGITTCVILLSLAVVMSMKRTCESTTDVLVLTPSSPGASQLPAEALRQIASSPELLTELLEKVPQSPEGSPSSSDYRQKNFSAKVSEANTPKTSETISAPIHFTLSFKASSPEISLQSATLWTTLFEKQLRKVYTSVGSATATKFEQDYKQAQQTQKKIELTL